jgi:carotenoid cleavage dioxygenase-like enzyme
VVSRSTGEVLHVYETPSAFCFHNINAWEEDDGTRALEHTHTHTHTQYRRTRTRTRGT